MKIGTWISGAAAICCGTALVFTMELHKKRTPATVETAISNFVSESATSPASSSFTSAAARAIRESHKLKVMAFGGSSAEGYDDPKLYGYLARALNQVSTKLNIPITFINEAKSGNIAPMQAPTFDPILHANKPNIVILSWGILNEISKKTSKSMFQRVIQSEVAQALKEGVDVWVVTPPATPATYVGHDVKPEMEYAAVEISAARSVNSPRVHVFDLLDDMKRYFTSHHLSYKPYESNNWHMNQAGHVLAGQLLGTAILEHAKPLGLTS